MSLALAWRRRQHPLREWLVQRNNIQPLTHQIDPYYPRNGLISCGFMVQKYT
ncbi:hypothetical protein GBAR_LOCUS20616 [Geodia barretti]|uniref:Uncharacterized protein n=1 Tax=Geodia barretti TaxID=519541 RepID=A0AA35SXG4_GEOBA|nr:hypothetical protein GBAR_LOCUS20616 [Geodia barretti]